MNDNTFFKPTPLYKEFMILDLIEKNKHITQREISEQVGVAVSMVNTYLDEYEKKGYIKRKYHSTKTVEYFVTKKGVGRKQVLNIRYLEASHSVYDAAKSNIDVFLKQIVEKGYKKILLYGAGEVAEILLQTLYSNHDLELEVTGVIDDDQRKQGRLLLDKKIISIDDIPSRTHDGILVSSYIHRNAIKNNLLSIGYKEENILQFFN